MKNSLTISATVLLVALLALYSGFRYLMARFYLDEFDAQANYIGSAYYEAIDIAFGQGRFFLNDQQLAHVLTPDLKEECTQDKLSVTLNNSYSIATHKCWLSSPGAYELYYKYCSAWRLERCNGLLLNGTIKKNKELYNAVMQVINDPCTFFPSDEVMHKEMDRYRSMPRTNADGTSNGEFLRFGEIQNYIHDKQRLGCGANKKPHYKLIIGFEGDAEDRDTIIKELN